MEQEKIINVPLPESVLEALKVRAAGNDRAANREAASIIKDALGYTASVVKA